jgi:hypothetical protein
MSLVCQKYLIHCIRLYLLSQILDMACRNKCKKYHTISPKINSGTEYGGKHPTSSQPTTKYDFLRVSYILQLHLEWRGQN